MTSVCVVYLLDTDNDNQIGILIYINIYNIYIYEYIYIYMYVTKCKPNEICRSTKSTRERDSDGVI